MRARVVLRSLRARLTLLAIAVIAVALAGAAIVLVELLQQDLQASIDDSVRTEARAAAATLEQGDAAGAADVGGETDTVVQILSADGRVIAASRSIAGKPALFRLPVGVPSRLHDIGTLPFANTADTYRVAGLASTHGRRVYVALASDDFRNTMLELRVALAAGLPVLL
ncbi:MAG: hypothetical protein JO222_11315, partial [Frankiales bacterium]|nr:hypothetical protein [Frankiales bacterium]